MSNDVIPSLSSLFWLNFGWILRYLFWIAVITIVILTIIVSTTQFGKKYAQIIRLGLQDKRFNYLLFALLTICILLILIESRIIIIQAYLMKYITDALQTRDGSAFAKAIEFQLLIFFLVTMIDFLEFAIRSNLLIAFNRRIYMKITRKWMHNNFYYYSLLQNQENLDNPDQRLKEEIPTIINFFFDTYFNLVKALATVFGAMLTLWQQSNLTVTIGIGQYSLFALHHTLFIIAVIYIFISNFLPFIFTRRVSKANYHFQKESGNFRFSLSRIRIKYRPIATEKGQEWELHNIRTHLRSFVRSNFHLNVYTTFLNFYNGILGTEFVGVFVNMIQGFQVVGGKISFGVYMQNAGLFGTAISYSGIVRDSFGRFGSCHASVNRLSVFLEPPQMPDTEITYTSSENSTITISHVDTYNAKRKPLINDFSCTIEPGEKVILTGTDISAQSSLMLSIIGLWPYAHGNISIPDPETTVSIGSDPYIPPVSLRHVLSFPLRTPYPEDQLIHVLQLTHLEHYAKELYDKQDWEFYLSTAEKQRIAIARLLLRKPPIILIDNALSAQTEEEEQFLLVLLYKQLSTSTIVTSGKNLETLHFDNARYVQIPALPILDNSSDTPTPALSSP